MESSWKDSEFATGLHSYSDKLKVSDLNDAKAEVRKVVEEIVKRIEKKDKRFQMRVECRGSIYEKLKIKDADEFDFDLPILSLEIAKLPSHVPGCPSSEYTIYNLEPNQKSWSDLADEQGQLSARKVIQTFANYVREAVSDMNADPERHFKFSCEINEPAVTVKFFESGKIIYDVDLAPVIEVKEWPDNLTKGWENRSRHGWPSVDVINKVKQSSIYLVAKLPKGMYAENKNLWRLAFNQAEKILILDSNTGVPDSCRRPVLRILKGFKSDFEWPLRSYHMKTVLLREFQSHKPSSWELSNLPARVHDAVLRLRSFLFPPPPECKHYFLPDVNLFQGMKEDTRRSLLAKIDKFLADPLAAVRRLNGISPVLPRSGSPTDFNILVRDMQARCIQVSVQEGQSIEEVKSLISGKKGIPKDQFRLIFNGHNLVNGTVKSNKIKAGSTIEMLGRLRGGR